MRQGGVGARPAPKGYGRDRQLSPEHLAVQVGPLRAQSAKGSSLRCASWTFLNFVYIIHKVCSSSLSTAFFMLAIARIHCRRRLALLDNAFKHFRRVAQAMR